MTVVLLSIVIAHFASAITSAVAGALGPVADPFLQALKVNETVFIDQLPFTLLALGDWGGKEGWVEAVATHTTPQQLSVARVAARSLNDASHAAPSAVLGLGDNIYEYGVESVDSPRFKETFEDVYLKYDSLRVPWFQCAGNHDHFGNVSAQLDYAHLQSTYWVWPSLWYSRRIFWSTHDRACPSSLSSPPLVEIVMLDSTMYNGMSLKRPFAQQIRKSAEHRRLLKSGEQRDFALARIAQSNAQFLIIVSHYPLMSVAEYGGYRSLIRDLQPALDERVARRQSPALFLSGHSHTMQHLSHNGVDYVVSGATSRVSPHKFNWLNVPIGSLRFHSPRPGLVRLQFSAPSISSHSSSSSHCDNSHMHLMKVTFIDEFGTILHSFNRTSSNQIEPVPPLSRSSPTSK